MKKPELSVGDVLKVVGWCGSLILMVFVMKMDIAVIKNDLVSVRSEIAQVREDIRELYKLRVARTKAKKIDI